MTIAQILDQWDAEVAEHGIWTSGHAIAAKMAEVLRMQPPVDPVEAAPAQEEATRDELRHCAQAILAAWDKDVSDGVFFDLMDKLRDVLSAGSHLREDREP